MRMRKKTDNCHMFESTTCASGFSPGNMSTGVFMCCLPSKPGIATGRGANDEKEEGEIVEPALKGFEANSRIMVAPPFSREAAGFFLAGAAIRKLNGEQCAKPHLHPPLRVASSRPDALVDGVEKQTSGNGSSSFRESLCFQPSCHSLATSTFPSSPTPVGAPAPSTIAAASVSFISSSFMPTTSGSTQDGLQGTTPNVPPAFVRMHGPNLPPVFTIPELTSSLPTHSAPTAAVLGTPTSRPQSPALTVPQQCSCGVAVGSNLPATVPLPITSPTLTSGHSLVFPFLMTARPPVAMPMMYRRPPMFIPPPALPVSGVCLPSVAPALGRIQESSSLPAPGPAIAGLGWIGQYKLTPKPSFSAPPHPTAPEVQGTGAAPGSASASQDNDTSAKGAAVKVRKVHKASAPKDGPPHAKAARERQKKQSTAKACVRLQGDAGDVTGAQSGGGQGARSATPQPSGLIALRPLSPTYTARHRNNQRPPAPAIEAQSGSALVSASASPAMCSTVRPPSADPVPSPRATVVSHSPPKSTSVTPTPVTRASKRPRPIRPTAARTCRHELKNSPPSELIEDTGFSSGRVLRERRHPLPETGNGGAPPRLDSTGDVSSDDRSSQADDGYEESDEEWREGAPGSSASDSEALAEDGGSDSDGGWGSERRRRRRVTKSPGVKNISPATKLPQRIMQVGKPTLLARLRDEARVMKLEHEMCASRRASATMAELVGADGGPNQRAIATGLPSVGDGNVVSPTPSTSLRVKLHVGSVSASSPSKSNVIQGNLPQNNEASGA